MKHPRWVTITALLLILSGGAVMGYLLYTSHTYAALIAVFFMARSAYLSSRRRDLQWRLDSREYRVTEQLRKQREAAPWN